MSLLTPLLPNKRRTEQPAVSGIPAKPQEWHVGLSQKGMFPHREASCPCAKAACGLAIPRPDVICPVHQGPHAYLQLHRASECGFPRETWLPRNFLRRQLNSKHDR
jgi:hypothetical protein